MSPADGCPVCGLACTGHPSHAHRSDYPFLPGGVDVHPPSKAGRDFVYAERRVVDAGRVVYGVGDPVPMADAIRFGLVAAPEPPPPAPAPKGRRKRRPQRDRAIHGPVETTAHHGPENDR